MLSHCLREDQAKTCSAVTLMWIRVSGFPFFFVVWFGFVYGLELGVEIVCKSSTKSCSRTDTVWNLFGCHWRGFGWVNCSGGRGKVLLFFACLVVVWLFCFVYGLELGCGVSKSERVLRKGAVALILSERRSGQRRVWLSCFDVDSGQHFSAFIAQAISLLFFPDSWPLCLCTLFLRRLKVWDAEIYTSIYRLAFDIDSD